MDGGLHPRGRLEPASPGRSAAAAEAWRDGGDRGGRLRQANVPDLVCELHYRDLHADPLCEVERLFQFLGAPTPPALIEQIVAATSFEALSGRRPGDEDPDAFLRKGVPDDWRAELDPESAQLIVESCADLMREKRFAA